MRTTRRKLLGLLGLGAAAAALGAGPAEARGVPPAIGAIDETGSAPLRFDGLTWHDLPRGQLAVSESTTLGGPIRTVNNNLIAQARADGYERGYAVAAARAESRQHHA